MNPLRMLKNPYLAYRLARKLHAWRIPAFPAMITYWIRFWFGCYLPHTARLGKCVILGYGGLGVVIHDETIVGDRVHIDQGVTLGGNAREPGAPEIGDDVYVGCGAKIIGPIKVGHGSVVGANTVVVKDVPENSVVVGIPARVIHEGIDIHQYLCHLKNRAQE